MGRQGSGGGHIASTSVDNLEVPRNNWNSMKFIGTIGNQRNTNGVEELLVFLRIFDVSNDFYLPRDTFDKTKQERQADSIDHWQSNNTWEEN